MRIFYGSRQIVIVFEKKTIFPFPPQFKDQTYEKYPFDIKLRDITEE